VTLHRLGSQPRISMFFPVRALEHNAALGLKANIRQGPNETIDVFLHPNEREHMKAIMNVVKGALTYRRMRCLSWRSALINQANTGLR
jgi:hypothetical protein